METRLAQLDKSGDLAEAVFLHKRRVTVLAGVAHFQRFEWSIFARATHQHSSNAKHLSLLSSNNPPSLVFIQDPVLAKKCFPDTKLVESAHVDVEMQYSPR